MSFSTRFALSALLLLLAVPRASAVGNIGDEAPPLDILSWVKGGPVDLKQGRGTNVYVVEFWATWCPPCRISIPALTALQKKYKEKGLVVVGVSSEEPGEVKPFVMQKGEEMNYIVAADHDTNTVQRYMGDYEISGIPTAFIVNREGKIAWVGSPLLGLSNAVERVLAGTLDLAESQRELLKGRIDRVYQSVVQKYLLLCSYGAQEQATEMGRKLLDYIKGDPSTTTTFAFAILLDGRLRFRDVKLAQEAAELATTATGRKDIVSLEALAMAQFYQGQQQQAIATIHEAIAKATDPKDRAVLEKNLAVFQEKAAAAAK